MEPWNLEIRFPGIVNPFPEVGLELKPTSLVYYRGTSVCPPPSDSTIVFTWAREIFIRSASSSPVDRGSNGQNLTTSAQVQQQQQQQPPQFWTVVGTSTSYVPTTDDVGCCLS